MKKLLSAAAAALLVAIFFVVWRTGLITQLSDHEQLVASMRESEVWGPLVCIAIQFVQVIVFFIPGEITQFAAGYVFGAWKGFLLAVTGIMLGSAFAYGCGMLLGRPALGKLFGEEALEKVDRAAHSTRAPTAIFLLFLLPGAPKDAMSYAAGVTGFPLGRFVLISGLGRTPALLVSTLVGGQVYAEDYSSVVLTLAIAAVVGLLFWLYQRRATPW